MTILFWGERDFALEVDLDCPCRCKVDLAENEELPEASSLEPVQPPTTSRPFFVGQNGAVKCLAHAQARARCVSDF